MVNKVGVDIWTMDGPEVVFAGASMHTRMTVVRLCTGRLWVHSPIELNEAVRAFVHELGGDVAALIGPNKFHYMYISSWCSAFPGAQVFAEEGLAQRVPSLGKAEILTNEPPSLYAQDIDQVLFGGNRLFQEAVFFHKASRSLIFTDLMINLRPDGVRLVPRLFLQFEGVTYPNGGVPRLYRWFSFDKEKARESLSVIRGWNPERVLFCHGEPFDLSAGEILDREFEYLK